jgi:hypothetical protein
MAEERKADDVEKLLTDQRALEDRKQALIADLLKQKEAAIKAFDEQLAKLGYQTNSSRAKRSHHKKADQIEPSKAKTKS